RPEMAAAIIEPNTVGCLKLIANVNIGKPIAVDVAEHGGKAEVERRFLERLAVLAQKPAVSPGNRGKSAVAVIQIKHIRLAEFDQQAVDDFQTFGIAAGDLWFAIDGADGKGAATAQHGVLS